MAKPRDYLINPRVFGQNPQARWKTDWPKVETAAAWRQHLLAVRVREAMEELTLANLAQMAKVPVGTLKNVLSGHQNMPTDLPDKLAAGLARYRKHLDVAGLAGDPSGLVNGPPASLVRRGTVGGAD